MPTNAKVSRTQYTYSDSNRVGIQEKKTFTNAGVFPAIWGKSMLLEKPLTHTERKKLITIRGILFCETSRGKLGRTRIHLTVDSRRRRVICD